MMTRVRTPTPQRVLCAALVLALTSEARIARAEEPPTAAVAQFERGQQAFDKGEYVEAARLWHATVELMPKGAARARARLVLDAATALEIDFDTSGIRKNLENSRAFVEFYAVQIDAAYPDTAERSRERARVRDRLARIDTKLEAPEVAALPPPKLVDRDDESERDDDEDDGSEMAAQLKRKHRGMIGGGVVLTLVGVGGLGMIAGGGLTDRKWLTYTGIGVAIVFGVIGPVMIGFGIRRKRRALSAAAPTTPRFGLHADRGGAGLTLSGRF
jgi:hypothetical protein